MTLEELIQSIRYQSGIWIQAGRPGNMGRRIVDWIFDKYDQRIEDKYYTGHGNFVSKRYWRLEVLGFVFERDYDKTYQ